MASKSCGCLRPRAKGAGSHRTHGASECDRRCIGSEGAAAICLAWPHVEEAASQSDLGTGVIAARSAQSLGRHRKLVGEGFDHPALGTLVLAMPISWKGTLQQYAGRLHRDHSTKTDVRIVDFVDTGHHLRFEDRARTPLAGESARSTLLDRQLDSISLATSPWHSEHDPTSSKSQALAVPEKFVIVTW